MGDYKPENAREALLELNIERLYLLDKETKALLDSVQQEREFFIQAIQAERNAYKAAFDSLKSFIDSQQAEMEIAVSAGVRRINEATTENAKIIAEQMAKNINAQTTEHGNEAKLFFDKNTKQSLEAIEKRRNELVNAINTEFLGTQVRGWFFYWGLLALLSLSMGLYISHDYLSKKLRDEIWQATSQFTKTKR